MTATVSTICRPFYGSTVSHVADLRPFALSGRCPTIVARCGRKVVRATTVDVERFPVCPKCAETV